MHLSEKLQGLPRQSFTRSEIIEETLEAGELVESSSLTAHEPDTAVRLESGAQDHPGINQVSFGAQDDPLVRLGASDLRLPIQIAKDLLRLLQ